MKQSSRVVTLILAILLFCFSLTGCDALDKARKLHGTWTESGNIRIGDKEYTPFLSNSEQLYFSFDYDTDPVMVTDSNVPLLLKNILGAEFCISTDGIFLLSYYENGETPLYCRTDRCNDIANSIENGFDPTGYCYSYIAYDEETASYSNSVYQFSADEVQAVDAVFSTVKPTYLPADLSPFNGNCDCRVSLMACTDDMLFREYCCDLILADGCYYLTQNTFENLVVTYDIPLEYHSVFASAMQEKLLSEAASDAYGGSFGLDSAFLYP